MLYYIVQQGSSQLKVGFKIIFIAAIYHFNYLIELLAMLILKYIIRTF